MTIVASQIQDLSPAGQIPVDDWNIMAAAVRQLLSAGSGGTGDSSLSSSTKWTIGSETWTLGGFIDGQDRRWLLVKFSDIDDLTTSNADARIPWQLRTP